jgi:hypothetical protein
MFKVRRDRRDSRERGGVVLLRVVLAVLSPTRGEKEKREKREREKRGERERERREKEERKCSYVSFFCFAVCVAGCW